jgi:hypothetical protein
MVAHGCVFVAYVVCAAFQILFHLFMIGSTVYTAILLLSSLTASGLTHAGQQGVAVVSSLCLPSCLSF